MTATPAFAADEAARLAGLRGLFVLDSPPEPLFDSLARMAADACGVPVALLSLVDEERQWFKANVGLPGVNETPRDIAFCSHAIQSGRVFEVADATLDPRFADNPLVVGTPDIRFYAGAPLVLSGGERVGTLCVIDRAARRLDAAQTEMLRSLAAIASQALQMRRDLTQRALAVRSDYERALARSEARYRAIVEHQTDLFSLARADGELLYVNPAYARYFDATPAALVGSNLFDHVEPRDRDAVREQIADVIRTGASGSTENRVRSACGGERCVAWQNTLHRGPDGEMLLHSVGRDVTERNRVEQALRASQGFLARTGRVAGVGGWELDLVTGVLTWSDETRRIHSVEPDYQPTLESAVAFYTPESRPVIAAAVQSSVQTGDGWDLELQIVTAAGELRTVRAAGGVEFERGTAVRLIGAVQDVTERRRLEQRLADNEVFMRQITDGSPVRMAYLDREQRYRFVNQAHCARFGRERDQILGRARSELPRGDAYALIGAKVEAALCGEAQRFEFDEKVAGETRRFESRLVPDADAQGNVRGIFTTGIDITERAAAEKALRLLTAIFDNTTDFVVQTDWRGRIAYMNPAARRVFGIAADEAVGDRVIDELNTPQTNRLFTDVIVPAVHIHGLWVGETTCRTADGSVVPVSHMVIAHKGGAGRIERYSSVMRDISAEARAKQQQARQTATLQSITEAIPAIVAVIGADGRYRFVNSHFERWHGLARERIVGHASGDVLGAAEQARSGPRFARALAGETVRFETSHAKRGGTQYFETQCVPLWLDTGTVDGFVAVTQDITQRKVEELRLRQLTQRDPLTGLLNRAGLEGFLERHARRDDGAEMALLYIDLDHFKPVNDAHGHAVGDQVLQLFARRLQNVVRPTDAVARLGGDEFALVLAGMSKQAHAQAVAAKVVAAAQAPFDLLHLRVKIGASVGIACSAATHSAWQVLLAEADAMMFRVKKAGRDADVTATR